MSNFILSANLPEKRVKTVVIGSHAGIIERLNSLGIDTIVLEDNHNIDFSVRNHADMASIHLGKDHIMLDKRQKKAAEKLEALEFDVLFTEDEISGEYPSDIRLNSIIISDKLICGKKGSEPYILSLPLEKIRVNQGYCRCSVCVLSDKAIITDDESIYKKTRDIFDVLLIEKGDILLDGKEYGFIGGASAKLDKNTIMFFGSLKYHRNEKQIKDFIRKHKMDYFELFDEKLTDIGSFTAVLEE